MAPGTPKRKLVGIRAWPWGYNLKKNPVSRSEFPSLSKIVFGFVSHFSARFSSWGLLGGRKVPNAIASLLFPNVCEHEQLPWLLVLFFFLMLLVDVGSTRTFLCFLLSVLMHVGFLLAAALVFFYLSRTTNCFF